jgi:hypothetical protein
VRIQVVGGDPDHPHRRALSLECAIDSDPHPYAAKVVPRALFPCGHGPRKVESGGHRLPRALRVAISMSGRFACTGYAYFWVLVPICCAGPVKSSNVRVVVRGLRHEVMSSAVPCKLGRPCASGCMAGGQATISRRERAGADSHSEGEESRGDHGGSVLGATGGAEPGTGSRRRRPGLELTSQHDFIACNLPRLLRVWPMHFAA